MSAKIYIKSISIDGFKSFGKNKQRFTFGPGVNLIAGPNGAGKSNVLDAVSFALCAQPASLRIQHLSELRNTDSDEPCEVELQIASQNGGGSLRIFTLEACVLPDSTRHYKLDGKHRTIKDIKEFLRDNHLLLEDSFAVLYQSKVTELADKNSPSVIASVLSSASGAGRWNEEVSRAAEEISNTRKSLASINQNIAVLERAIAADEERVRAMDRQKQIDHEFEELRAQLRGYVLRQLASQEDSASEISLRIEKVRKDKALLLEEKKSSEGRGSVPQGNGIKEITSWEQERVEVLQKMAQVEEELQIEENRRERGLIARMQLQSLGLQIQRFEQAYQESVHVLEEKQETLALVEKDLKQLSRLEDDSRKEEHVIEILNRTEKEINEIEIAIKDQEGRSEEAASVLAETEYKTEEIRTKLQSNKQKLLLSQVELARSTILHAELGAELARLEREREQLKKVTERAERTLHVAVVRLGTMDDKEGEIPAWSLHSLFHFKADDRLMCNQYLEALKAISGTLQNVCVVNTTKDAGRLLQLWQSTVQDSRFRRIWPLDRLTSPEVAQKQRKAQQSFQSGEVTLPLELLDFNSKFAKALNKAFGGYVIASNDRVARELISKHRLWNVTLDGKVSRVGSVQGGWRGTSGNSFIEEKYKSDFLRREAEKLRTQLGALDQEIKTFLDTQEQTTSRIREEEAFMTAQKDDNNHLRNAEVDLSQARLVKEEFERRLECLRQELTLKRERLRKVVRSKEAEGEEEAVARALEAIVEEEVAQQIVVDEALRSLEEAKEKETALRDELNAVLELGIDSRIQGLTVALQGHRQDLAHVETLRASKVLEQQQRSKERTLALKRVQECEDEIRKCETAAEQLEKQKNELLKKKNALQEELAHVGSEYEGNEENSKDDIESDKQFMAAKVRQRHLLEEKERLAAEKKRVTMDEQVAFKERVENLQVFKERAQSIVLSIEKLNEGIRMTREKVQIANETAFTSIRGLFIDCCKSLLPDKRVDLIKVKEHVEDGVKFLFRTANVESETGRSNQAREWKSDLRELSGGQRTMISLAFILTVAMSGRSSLYIMDEVDAALDEQNQRRVAALIKDVISKESQVLCVSHNRSFQMFSDTIIQLSRREGSSKADAMLTVEDAKKKQRQN